MPSHFLFHRNVPNTATVNKRARDHHEELDSDSDSDDAPKDDHPERNSSSDQEEKDVLRMLGARRSRGRPPNSRSTTSALQDNGGLARGRGPGSFPSSSLQHPTSSSESHGEDDDLDQLQSSSSSSSPSDDHENRNNKPQTAGRRRPRRRQRELSPSSSSESESRSRPSRSKSVDNGESKKNSNFDFEGYFPQETSHSFSFVNYHIPVGRCRTRACEMRNADLIDPGGTIRAVDSDSDDSDSDSDENEGEEEEVIYLPPSWRTQQRWTRTRKNRMHAQPTDVSASASGIHFANGGLDFIPLESSDSSESSESDSDDAEIQLELTYNDGPAKHFTPHEGCRSASRSAENNDNDNDDEEEEEEDDDNISISESVILAYGAVPFSSDPRSIVVDIDDVAVGWARLGLDKERNLISVTRLPQLRPGRSSTTRGAAVRAKKHARGRPSARTNGSESNRTALSRPRAGAAGTSVMMDIDDDSDEQGETDGEVRETAHERFERRRREKAASAALNAERRRKKKNRKRRQKWYEQRPQHQHQQERHQQREGGQDEDGDDDDGRGEDNDDEVRKFLDDVLADPYVRHMLAEDSPSSDYDGIASPSSDESSDAAQGNTRRARSHSRARKRARASANVPLSRQRRFRADDPIPVDDYARITVYDDDEENDDLYDPVPEPGPSNPAFAGRSIIPYTSSARDKLLAFDKSRKALNVGGVDPSSWDDMVGNRYSSMDVDVDTQMDFIPLSSGDMDTTSSISSSAATVMANGAGAGRAPLFLPTPTPGPESVASSSLRAPPLATASTKTKQRTPTPEPEIPLPQRIAMEIAAHGVPDPDDDDDLPDFEDEEEGDEGGEEITSAEVQPMRGKEEEERVKKEEEEMSATERNEEIRKMKEQEWEMLRYVYPYRRVSRGNIDVSLIERHAG